MGRRVDQLIFIQSFFRQFFLLRILPSSFLPLTFVRRLIFCMSYIFIAVVLQCFLSLLLLFINRCSQFYRSFLRATSCDYLLVDSFTYLWHRICPHAVIRWIRNLLYHRSHFYKNRILTVQSTKTSCSLLDITRNLDLLIR